MVRLHPGPLKSLRDFSVNTKKPVDFILTPEWFEFIFVLVLYIKFVFLQSFTCVIVNIVMAKRFKNIEILDQENREYRVTDAYDEAFWDEFWSLELKRSEEAPLVTVTIRDQETGDERVVKNVRLRFRVKKRLRDS